MIANLQCIKTRPSAGSSLAVLVRVRNERRALNEFWSRLSSQTIFSKIECVFLDSESTDGTLEFLRELPVTLYQIASSDFNFGSSCNFLMAESRSPIAVFLSGHVLLEEQDALERLHAVLSRDESAAAYMRQVPNSVWGASIYERAYLAKRFPPKGSCEAYEMLKPSGFSNAGSGLTRAAWLRNPFPEVHGSEDFMWAEKHLKLGGKLFYLPNITILHSHMELPDTVFQRVRLNALSRGVKGSYLKSTYYFCGILASMLSRGASLKEAFGYARSHARAYLPSALEKQRQFQ